MSVERLAPHAKYFKRIRSTKRYTVQDENNVCKVGDYVRLEGCRPLSKNKRFTVAEVGGWWHVGEGVPAHWLLP